MDKSDNTEVRVRKEANSWDGWGRNTEKLSCSEATGVAVGDQRSFRSFHGQRQGFCRAKHLLELATLGGEDFELHLASDWDAIELR